MNRAEISKYVSQQIQDLRQVFTDATQSRTVRYGGLAIIVVGAGFAAWELLHQNTPAPVESALPLSGGATIYPTPEIAPIPTNTPAPTETRPPALRSGQYYIIYDGNEWSCAKVDPPGVPNAFRAIQAAATPGVWEDGPYLYRHGLEEPRISGNWNDFALSYAGDDLCDSPVILTLTPPVMTP